MKLPFYLAGFWVILIAGLTLWAGIVGIIK